MIYRLIQFQEKFDPKTRCFYLYMLQCIIACRIWYKCKLLICKTILSSNLNQFVHQIRKHVPVNNLALGMWLLETLN